MGKASRKKNKGGKIRGLGTTKSEDKRTGFTSKATPLSLIILAASVAVVTFIVFLPALQNEFLNWDDEVYVFDNPNIYLLNTTFFRWAFFDFYQSNWHPLTWISHAMDYAVWGLNPLGHHLTNIVLHAVNTFIVVLLITRLIEIYKERMITEGSTAFLDQRKILMSGGVTGLLFGLHPVHVESVAWVAERKDLLCALFFLLSIMVYTKYMSFGDKETVQRKAKSRFLNKHYLFSLCFFALALLSKPMAVSLPVVLLILDWYPFKKIQSLKTFGTAVINKLPFIVLSLISAVLTIQAHRAGVAMNLMKFVPLASRMLVAAKSLIVYLGKMILPINLIPYYPYPQDVSRLPVAYLLSSAVVVGITMICVVIAKRQRILLSVWCYYVVTLIPVLGIVQVGAQSMADRYTYLPSLGPFLVMGLITAEIYERVTNLEHWRLILRIVGVIAAIVMLVSMSYGTLQQIGVWKNSLVFWNYVIEKEPGRVPLAHNNLGNAYQSKGLYDMAIEQYQTALRLMPDYAEARYNLGNTYQSKGQLDMAIEQYQTALRLKPDYAKAQNNLGVAYASKGQLDMGMEQFQLALRLKPDYADAHCNLGIIYKRKGLKSEAIRELETALEIRPNFAKARQVLASIAK
ncbi:MAG: tetratricopeptide repeat protein [Thermodesulfovibrionales bacterium]|jgi:lipoprotein NlpI